MIKTEENENVLNEVAPYCKVKVEDGLVDQKNMSMIKNSDAGEVQKLEHRDPKQEPGDPIVEIKIEEDDPITPDSDRDFASFSGNVGGKTLVNQAQECLRNRSRNVYICSECKVHFTLEHELRKHYATHESVAKLQCKVCGEYLTEETTSIHDCDGHRQAPYVINQPISRWQKVYI